jgi:hypothetical protein
MDVLLVSGRVVGYGCLISCWLLNNLTASWLLVRLMA